MTNDIAAILPEAFGQLALSDARKASLLAAVGLGADLETLNQLASATRLAKSLTIVLPALRYESLSRGRGWARKGRGTAVTWGERVEDGYQVGPGSWEVGATDGFSRKDKRTWAVKHVRVGDQTWTIAN
jgi:hypothetical protein